MNRYRKVAFLSAAVLGVAVIAIPVYAHCGKCAASAKNMIDRLKQTDFTLEKAVKMAEKHTNGTALAAFAHTGSETVEMKVFTLAEGKIMAVKIDPQSARVVKAKETKTLPIPTEHEHNED